MMSSLIAHMSFVLMTYIVILVEVSLENTMNMMIKAFCEASQHEMKISKS